ncbi:MAG: DPP IV N-terminal domain-containing protein [Alistipes sp.]|nr:DPP IV N-terminal domain-containing protein [Candidatus Minthomonas equi]
MTSIASADYNQAEKFSIKKMGRLVKSRDVNAHWFRDSDRFWYEWTDTEGTNYYIVDPVSKTKTEIFDLEALAVELTELTHDSFDAQHIPIKKLKLKDDNTFTFSLQSNLLVPKKDDKDKSKTEEDDTASVEKTKFIGTKDMEKKLFRFEYDIKSRKLTDVSDIEEEKDFPDWACVAPDTSSVLYVKGYNVFWTDMTNLRKLMKNEKDSTVVEHQMTFDGTSEIPYGCDNYKGALDRDTTKRYPLWGSWSPDGRTFASLEYDMSGVKQLWVINSITEPRPTIEKYRYQMPGEPNPKESLHIFNMTEKSHRRVDVTVFKDQESQIFIRPKKNRDEFEKYSRRIWMGDDDSFWMMRCSRGYHDMQICRYDVKADTATVVLEEKSNSYIDVFDFNLISSGNEFILMSEKTGWSHLYLYGADGKLKNPITKGSYHVDDILEIDEKARVVYFTASGYGKDRNPYYLHAYRVGFDGTGLKEIDPDDYNSKYSISDDGKYLVSNYSRVDTTPANALFSTSGTKIMELEKADFRELFRAGYKFPETFKVKAADGITDLYGVMYKPYDFDSTKVYPIIDYVYPGPQVEATYYSWTNVSVRTDRLAQLGVIVISVGNRGGHPMRSKWYHSYGYGNMRDYPLEDHKTAVQQLAAQYDWIDGNKVGIHGHSGGGFMSTAAILTYPDFYKVAVSCAGNHDNRIYNRWWSETHHGVKEIVSEKDTTFEYSIHYNEELAKNLKGHLLLVHGDIDDNVHPANSIRMVNALIRANKRFDMLILPGQRHGFGDMNEYFFWKMADYFSRYLIGDCQTSVDIPQMNND